MRIIDCFMMLDELDMLEFRLRLLEGLVDCTVVIESNLTHSGREKPFNFEAVRDTRFAWIKDKIVYLKFTAEVPKEPEPLPDLNPTSPFFRDLTKTYIWRERGQRDVLMCAENLFTDTDIIMIGDIDEIPTRELLEDVRQSPGAFPLPFCCEQEHFHYSLKWRSPKSWYGTVVTDLAHLKQLSPQDHRDRYHTALHNNYNTIGEGPLLVCKEGGGWHLSFFQPVEGIQYKVESYSHQELNRPQFTNPDNIMRAMQNGTDMFGIGIKFRSGDEVVFPDYFKKLMLSFPQLFGVEAYA